MARYSKILVWDWPTRLGHWALAIAFAVAYISAESERWRLVHVFSGLVVAGAVIFRLVWGFCGTRHALFKNFLAKPGLVIAYLLGLMRKNPPHFTGHNPAGAVAVVLLLVLSGLTALTGVAAYNSWGPAWLTNRHELVSNLTLSVVVVHLLGVFWGSFAHKENLVTAMLTGRKLGMPSEEIGSAQALWLLAWSACVGIVGWLFL